MEGSARWSLGEEPLVELLVLIAGAIDVHSESRSRGVELGGILTEMGATGTRKRI